MLKIIVIFLSTFLLFGCSHAIEDVSNNKDPVITPNDNMSWDTGKWGQKWQ